MGNNLTIGPIGAAPPTEDRGQPGGDSLAAALDLNKIPPVLKSRLQLVAPPPVIFRRRRPTIKTTVAQDRGPGAAGGDSQGVAHV